MADDVSDPTVSDQTGSHADAHDLDKLGRWKTGLSADSTKEDSFPIYAIFLVSGEDQDAHNVFRRFRTTFGELDAGFDNLIIFGQHGTSTTMLSFLSELNLSVDRVPALALTSGPTSNEALIIGLPKGTRGTSEGKSSGPWDRALELIGEAAPTGSPLDLGELESFTVSFFSSGSLFSTIETILESLQTDI